MRELIYMWIQSTNKRATFINQEIQFSDNYIVNILEKDCFDYIQTIEIKEKESLYDNIYGNSILNISALVGINGIGKTTLLEMLGSTRNFRKKYIDEWSYFILYRVDEKYVIEGMNINYFSDFIEGLPPNVNDIFSLWCSYDKETKKFRFEDLCHEDGVGENKIKFFYFHDNPIDENGYLTNEYDNSKDNNICFERIYMNSDPKSIYKTCFELQKNEEISRSIYLRNLNFSISVDNMNVVMRPSKELTFEIRKKMFVMKIYLAIAFKYGGKNAVSRITTNNRKEENNKNEKDKYIDVIDFDLEVYENCKKEIINIIKEANIKDEIDLNNLQAIVDKIPNSNFIVPKRNLGFENERVEFSVSDGYSEQLYQLLLYFGEYIRFTYRGISAGEKKVIDIFSAIYTHLVGDGEKNENTYIVLLDEPDKGLHPEMSRQVINYIFNMFKKIDGNKYQFIISTHSPYLISDIPVPFIHCLQRDSDSGNWNTEILKSQYGLLNNIPDILKDTFFMESPFGKFGEEYFKDLLNELKGVSNSSQILNFRKKIKTINDTVLRNYLNKQVETKLTEIGDKDEQIIYYEQKLKELKGEN